MGNCASFSKSMLSGEEGGSAPVPLPEQPTEETAAPQVQEVEKIVETKEDENVVEDKTVDEGEKKPEPTVASFEEASSTFDNVEEKIDSSAAGETPEVEEKKDSAVIETPEVAPSTAEKPAEEKEVAEIPVVVAEVAKEETK